MALFMNAEEALLASINAKNSISIKPGELIFGPGQNVNDITPKPNTTKNSSVLVRSNTPNYTSSTRINYDRLDFGTVFSASPLNTLAKLRAYRPSTVHDLIEPLNDYYGLQLTKDDILDGNLNLVDGVGTAIIKAAPGSLGWIGQFTVSITPGDAKLSKWITDTDLEGVAYPSGQTVKGQAEVYSYRYDASDYWPMLSELVIDNPDGIDVPPTVIDMMIELTNHSWQNTEDGDYSLVGAKLKYAGPNDLNRPTNDRYANVIEIKLGEGCANLSGMLRFHYDGANGLEQSLTVTGLDFDLNSMSAYDPANGDDPTYAADRHNPMLDTRYNDYTEVYSVLSTITWKATQTPATTAELDKLVACLKSKDGLPWNRTVGADYSVAGAWIAYNGPAANMPSALLNGMTAEEFHREGVNQVLVFFPPASQQANLWYGIGYMYYNA